MNKNLDLTKILKDCPKGTEFYSRCLGVVKFESINDALKCIILKNQNETVYYKETGVYYYADENAEIDLFPSKDQRDWSKWHRPFIDGDIVYYDKFVSIFKKWGDFTLFYSHISIEVNSGEIKDRCFGKFIHKESRFATEEEKQKLFDVIKLNGFKWNAETKTLEKVLEEDKTFKNGDIIVSTFNNIAIFSHTKKNSIGQNVVYYHCLYSEKPIIKFKALVDCGIGYVEDCRLATEHEKKLMIEAIRKYGYKWNKETKTLEKLIVPKFKVGDKIKYKIHIIKENIVTEIKDTHYILDDELALPFINQDNYELLPNKFDPKTLKPFDKVLVRDIGCNMCWRIQFFESIHECNKNYPFMCLGGKLYSFCIPYNDDTKHLIEKLEEAPEFYRYWEN